MKDVPTMLQCFSSPRLRFGLAAALFLFFACTRLEAPARSEPAHSPVLPSSAALAEAPALILWAWERPEDLRFLTHGEAGVAFLARTLTLSSDTVEVRPRLNPLHLPQGVRPIAVARLEVPPLHPATLSRAQLEATVRALIPLGTLEGIQGIQLDFDATTSQRAFYRELIERLRGQLPPHLPLSITALTSWCMDDRWMAGLPVDEAIPMLFRMGRDRDAIRKRLAQGETFLEPLCQQSVGLATDERLTRFPRGRRTYLFHPRAWTGRDLEEALQWVR